MTEPTRPLLPPLPLPGGGWVAKSVASSISYKVRGMVFLPPNRIIPVIVVPGIMGTNLRAKLKPRSEKEQNEEVKPGEPAWRPPNTMVGGFWDSLSWDRLTPERRQRLFNPDTLEVDDSGPAHIAHGDGRYHVNPVDVRQRWWGELHADSYGALLCGLETRLNEVFTPVSRKDERCIAQHWKDVMAIDPQRWGVRRMKPLTEAELEKHARFHFPVYACGYNWLESCGKSSQRLEQRILQIIEYWKGMKKKCEQVILVTHSMGGLVARACAKRIPDQIAGVIHGVMPALGAPAAYRRLACGTEAPNFVASRIAKILGTTTYHTTPVLATSPGALELLPNHLYPRPWLHVRVMYPGGPPDAPETAFDYLHLPNAVAPNPYDLYRDMRRWYRLIDPELADPTGRFEDVPGGVIETIKTAVETAEQFHMKELGDYYHPNTYAFYGDDSRQLSFGQVRWVGRKESSAHVVFTPANVASATPMVTYGEEGARLVLVEHDTVVLFKPEPADTRGDGTVPHQSGAGPADKVRRLFETRGYDHQGSYNNDDMLALTLRLIVKIVQGMP